LELERKNRGGVLVDPFYTIVLSSKHIGLVNELAVDMQVERKIGVQKLVPVRNPEFLITIKVSLIHISRLLLDYYRGRQPTFPASLATKALIKDGPSRFTSKVSSSFSSHLIVQLNFDKRRGMVRV
jgi:hypothetical protein